jgi:DNA polymerase-3 subunit epsilon
MKTVDKLNLELKKPLAFIKIQTTGLNSESDRIIELSITKISKDGKKQTGTRKFNPGMPIPKTASDLNGITDEMVKDSPTFQEVASKIKEFLGDCDFIGFNIRNFDLKFLSEEFARANVEFTFYNRKIIDLSLIYHTMEPRDFRSAARFYCDEKVEFGTPLSSDFVNDTNLRIFNSMLETYSEKQYQDRKGNVYEFKKDIEVLNNLFNDNKGALDINGYIVLNADGKPVLNTGQKYKGQLFTIIAADKGYCDWFIKESNMPADTKLVFKKLIAKAEAAVVAENK